MRARYPYTLVDIEGHKCRYTGGGLILTHQASRHAGHWAPPGGAPSASAHGQLIREAYKRFATSEAMASGRDVEVSATHPRAQPWIVYVAEVEPLDEPAQDVWG